MTAKKLSETGEHEMLRLPNLVDIKLVAVVLGLHVETVRQIPVSELPKYKIGRAVRYSPEDVRRFLAERRRD